MTKREALAILAVIALARVSRACDELAYRLAAEVAEPEKPRPVVVPRPRPTIIYDVQRLSLDPSGYRFVRGGEA